MVRISASSSVFVVLAGGLSLLLAATSCAAFQVWHPITMKGLGHYSITRLSSNKDDVPSSEGQELAGQFYEQLKRRSNENPAEDEPVTSPLPTRKESTQRQDFTFSDTPPSPVRKFTGASPSLFSEQSSSSSSSNNLEREREREFTLVGNFERTLGIQVAVLFASIVFVTSVGLTGGITDGSDRNFGGADEYDSSVIEYLQTDDAAEAAMLRQSTQESQWI